MLKHLVTLLLFSTLAFTGLSAQDTAKATSLKIRPAAERCDPENAQPHPAAPLEIRAAAADETPEPQIVDYTNPDSFFEEGFIGSLKAGLLAIFAALGGFIPGLRKLDNKWLRSGIVVFVCLAALATFKQGALTENFFNLITGEFLPNFAYAGLVYKAFQLIKGLIVKKAQQELPTT